MSILQDLRIPEEQIFRMEIENPEGAEKYQDIIERTVPDTSFDMIMLGIGQDGHTLSLFPNTEALKEKERLIVFQRVPQLDTERMTFTLPLAYRAKHIVVYVQGENKKDIVRSIFFPSDKQREAYPIELIGQEKTPLFWILAPDTYDSKDFDSISSFHKLDIL